MITDRRLEKIKRVVSRRQNMTVILENVHDKHNIGAVMRTCDSVGIQELFVVYSDDRIDKDDYKVGLKSASSARKWLNTHFYDDLEECIEAVRARYDLIFATHLGEKSSSIYELDLSQSIAFLFGNEKDGVSAEAMKYVDQNLIIPQVGMIQSLNISVACAVTLYEAKRQRIQNGKYDQGFDEGNESHQTLLDQYIAVNNARYEHRKL